MLYQLSYTRSETILARNPAFFQSNFSKNPFWKLSTHLGFWPKKPLRSQLRAVYLKSFPRIIPRHCQPINLCTSEMETHTGTLPTHKATPRNSEVRQLLSKRPARRSRRAQSIDKVQRFINEQKPATPFLVVSEASALSSVGRAFD